MPQILSERIAALRKERGLTQEQLGRLVGVSSQAVGKWEKGGAPDVELLPILSRQLGVTIDALFGLEDGPQEALQDTLARQNILRRVELELEEGAGKAYQLAEPLKFIPFLYLARCMMQSDLNSLRVGDETPPLGPDEVWKAGEEAQPDEEQ